MSKHEPRFETPQACSDFGLDLDVTAGTTYPVSVDGFDYWGSGFSTVDFYFNWNFTKASAPANDNWAYAAPITSASGSVSGTNAGATVEPGEPSSPYGHTVWYHCSHLRMVSSPSPQRDPRSRTRGCA